jgi:hypothetical protein
MVSELLFKRFPETSYVRDSVHSSSKRSRENKEGERMLNRVTQRRPSVRMVGQGQYSVPAQLLQRRITNWQPIQALTIT